MIVEAWDHGCGAGADGDASFGELADGIESGAWGGGARFEDAGEFGIEGGDGEVDGDGLVACEFAEVVEIAGDESVFGDESDGMAEAGEDLEAAAGELEVFFDGLVAIGDAAHGEATGLEGGFGEGLFEELGGPGFDEDDGFEVEAGGVAKVFVIGACVAVGAAVFAAAVGVEGVFEGEVLGGIRLEDGLGIVVEVAGAEG